MVSDEAVVKPEDIRAVRKRLGYSQTEFGALFQVFQPAVDGLCLPEISNGFPSRRRYSIRAKTEPV